MLLYKLSENHLVLTISFFYYFCFTIKKNIMKKITLLLLFTVCTAFSQNLTLPDIPANGFIYVINQTDNVLNFSDEGDWDFSDATQGYDVNGSFGIAQEAPNSANYPLATHYKFESGSYFFLGFDETGYTYHGEQGGAINFTTAYDPPLSIFPFPFNNDNSPYSDSVIDQPFTCTDCPPSLFRDDSSYSTIVSEGDVTLPNGDIYTNVTLVENVRTFTDRQTGSSPCITTLVVRQLFAEGLVIPVMETLSFTNTGSCAPNPYGYTKFLDSIAESGSCPNPSITQWNMGSDSVSFDGTNNSSISSYEVEYNLGSTFTPGDGTASTFSFSEFPATITGLENASLYYFTIRSICTDGTVNSWIDNGLDGPDPWQTTSCTTNSLPYFNNFNDTESWVSCNTFYDSDGDGNFWFYADYNDDGDGVNNNYSAGSQSWSSTAGVLTPDNWLVIGPIDLTNVSNATMTWRARGLDPNWCGENYTVYVGTENTVENLTNSSITFNETTSNDACGAWADRTLDISAASGSLIYIGFRHHAVSDMNQLNIDDLGVTGTSLGLEDVGELQFSFFPNPVNNVLTINAQASIDNITVYNMLGQTVITSTPNTNDSKVDMSALQTGAYFIQVSINNTLNTVRVIKN